MITGDGAYIKKINRSIILSKIVEHGMISRADLSKITGLNKATISIQVADLLSEDLICETRLEHNVVGRRPIMLSINKDAGYVLGIDLDYNHIQYMVSDLGGNPVQHDSIELEIASYEELVHLLIKQIQKYKNDYSKKHYGLVSVMIGIHGTVNKDESIYFVPSHQWQNKSLKTDLMKELDMDISIQNNANLSAYSERVYKHHESNHLLCLLFSSGIGSGIMIDGKLHKGFHGYAGEMGHMIISKDGEACRCGNKGCWELYSSEPSLLARLAMQLGVPKVTHDDIQSLLAKQDPTTLQLMKQYIVDLSIGLNNIINIYNPETLVLTSELLKMYPNAIEEIKNNLNSAVSQYGELVISDFGNSSCALGACALAIQRFLEVPELILTLTEDTVLVK
ncbi:ROK family transcriptional regulator [Sporosarcina beigongshangi]|uniref:ROK family transcriptional regulator n=1 Tax=Sporosarcina beigongshangi TaxID=2782538 RepID=UPI00193A1EA1|nr:ROK family transcriptional regulator [Sporosarcina beigongshangi]